MSTFKAFLTIGVALIFSGTFSTVNANPYKPNLVDGGNRWLITFYNDASPIHQQWATQGLCFYQVGVVGTHARYYWVSDTYPDWNGWASQEGDQVFVHGDFQYPRGRQNGGHDGMEWEITTTSRGNVGFGHWKEWIEDAKLGRPIGFGNARFQRVGKCQFDNVGAQFEYGMNLEQPKNERGDELLNPMGTIEQESITK